MQSLGIGVPVVLLVFQDSTCVKTNIPRRRATGGKGDKAGQYCACFYHIHQWAIICLLLQKASPSLCLSYPGRQGILVTVRNKCRDEGLTINNQNKKKRV